MTARRIAQLFALCLASLMIVLAPTTAMAQDGEDPVVEEEDTGQAEAELYPGPFGDEVLSAGATADGATEDSDPDVNIVPPNPQPGTGDGADDTVGGTGGGLANTGSEVEPIIAIAIGMFAVGGSALVSSRRRIRDIFSGS